LSHFAVWQGLKQAITHNAFSSVCFMALHYQVYANFKFSNGKSQLVSTSIFSTQSAITTIPENYFYSSLTTSRTFRTLKEAYSYIAYLQGVYKTKLPPPVLDSGQKELF
jgi:hypothetical protein